MQRPPWDPDKERSNRARHAVGFDEAQEAVLDQLSRRWPDAEHSFGEPRYVVIGESISGRLLFVVVTADAEGKMRIISARRATKREAMSTKTTDRRHPQHGTAAPAALGPASLVSVAYWLEDDLGNRISKLYASSDKPLKLAGRALDNVGSLEGWTVARRDVAGTRHVVASGTDLETLATPFLPVRTVEEAAAMRRFDEARRSMGFRRGNVVTDERVY